MPIAYSRPNLILPFPEYENEERDPPVTCSMVSERDLIIITVRRIGEDAKLAKYEAFSIMAKPRPDDVPPLLSLVMLKMNIENDSTTGAMRIISHPSPTGRASYSIISDRVYARIPNGITFILGLNMRIHMEKRIERDKSSGYFSMRRKASTRKSRKKTHTSLMRAWIVT